jgi:hypothetical protein
MRSTRAAAAVYRLNQRSPERHHVMTRTGNGLFYLCAVSEAGAEEPLCEPMMQDEFVQAVNAMGPQEVRRITKNDAAFEKQLVRKPKE